MLALNVSVSTSTEVYFTGSKSVPRSAWFRYVTTVRPFDIGSASSEGQLKSILALWGAAKLPSAFNPAKVSCARSTDDGETSRDGVRL